MNEQELIDALNATEAERVRWMTAALTTHNEIAALKVQVNCLREVLEQLAKLGNGDKYGNSIGNTLAINALAKTPEQCLAEVKAKAIKEYKQNLPNVNGLSVETWKRMFRVL